MIFQFTMTMLLLIGTITIYKQVNFMRSQELGMNLDQTIVVMTPIVPETQGIQEQKRKLFKAEMERLSQVNNVTFSQTLFGQGTIDMSTTGMHAVETEMGQNNLFYFFSVDAEFVPAFEMKVLAGRAFDENLEQLFDSTRYTYQGIMVNETSRKIFGFETNEAAIGGKINRWGRTFSIIGVLEDYNHHSLKSTIDPTVIFYDKYGVNGSYISIKVNGSEVPGGSYKNILSDAEKVFSDVYPSSDFDYYFLDEKFNQQYKADQQFGKVFTTFAGLAIFISILGLFGLVLFEVQQRVKEIGVRKVLGANPLEIVQLLSKNFMKLIIASIVIAMPLSFLLIQNWLASYASRISIGWTLFVLPALVLALIALVTIGLQSYRAANENPIDALRYE